MRKIIVNSKKRVFDFEKVVDLAPGYLVRLHEENPQDREEGETYEIYEQVLMSTDSPETPFVSLNTGFLWRREELENWKFEIIGGAMTEIQINSPLT